MKRSRFKAQYGLNDYDAVVLTATRELADYFEAVVKAAGCDAKLCANWVMGELSGALNKAGVEIEQSPLEAARLAGLIQRIADDTISGKIAKQVFDSPRSLGITAGIVGALGLIPGMPWFSFLGFAAVLLAPRVGETFDAVVTGAKPTGTFVRLLDPPDVVRRTVARAVTDSDDPPDDVMPVVWRRPDPR